MDSYRQDLVRNAVLFLQDPKVQTSPLQQRIEFLQGKGLSEPEIQQALSEAANPTSAAPTSPVPGPAYARTNVSAPTASPYGFGTMYAPPPEPPRRDWRDVFIMAVISGGVVYGLTALARKYIAPHLKPPSSTAFQETSSDLTAQYDAAQAALDELREQTTALAAASEGERARVSAALEDVENAARVVRDAEQRWRDDMREVRGEVESVRELVPRLIEKHSQAQNSALTELQSELRSLKTLLVARQSAQHQGAVASPNTPAPDTLAAAGSGPTSPTPTPSVSATQHAANALLQPRGKASIPAWQLAPANGGSSSTTFASSASATPSASSGASSPTKE